jgi:CRP-like cAMP-binding protein
MTGIDNGSDGMSDLPSHTDLLLRKLNLLVPLQASDEDAIRQLPFSIEIVRQNRMLVREGTTVSRCCLLAKGYAARHKMSRQGKRQIVAFHMPGDLMDIQHSLLPRADHNLEMMTSGAVAWLPLSELKNLALSCPRVAQALATDALVDASIFREWVLNVGCRDAKTRVAHMLCEFIARREAVGVSPVEKLELPLTQEQIADATGLTPVHVNRMLRILTEEGAFTHVGREFTISDWGKLKLIADFEPAYLHGTALEQRSS